MGFGRVFLFIFVFALLEAMVLGQVAQAVGWGVTILLTVFTAMLGSVLFRSQGLQTWMRLNSRLQRGEVPGQELVEGVMLLLGGALLITPGFITDAIGFVLLLPQGRRMLAAQVVKHGMMQAFVRAPGQGNVWVYQSNAWETDGGRSERPFQSDSPRQKNQVIYEDRQGNCVIEGEVERKDDNG